MHRTLIIGLVACLSVPAAHAAGDSSKEEGIGIGVGATVGALAGGPAGAIVGAAIGAGLGDRYHHKNEQVAELSDSLQASRAELADLQQTIADLDGKVTSKDKDIARLRASSRPQLVSLLTAGIDMELLFRTDERVLADTTQGRLKSLAASLASMPDVRVQLDGFADERGDAAYNEKLSAERADYVRQLLVDNGVDAARISVTAHGESPAAEASADSYALERKVSMTLFVDKAPSFAANPERD